MSAESLKNYFAPLIEYLDEANKDYHQDFPSSNSNNWMPCAAGECPPKNDGSEGGSGDGGSGDGGSGDGGSGDGGDGTDDAATTILSSALLALFALLW